MEPVKDGIPVRVVQQPIAGDHNSIRGPDLDVIKTLAGDAGFGTDCRHEGTLAVGVDEHDIEAGVSLLAWIIGKQQCDVRGLQGAAGEITKQTVSERASVRDLQALSSRRSHEVEAATNLERHA